jgi:hypothetical protein
MRQLPSGFRMINQVLRCHPLRLDQAVAKHNQLDKIKTACQIEKGLRRTADAKTVKR